MSHPYVPLGTPVTITVDGHWDGYHNGNEPYLSYVGHDGQTKKIHIPHGALVQTKPEQVEAQEFTVDKTPKPQPTYPDFSKLRAFRDNYNLMWWEVEPNKFHPADSRSAAEASAKAWPKDYRDMAYLTEHYTLTDVTDTGEPLPRTAAELGAMSVRASLRDAGLGIPERFECSRCDDSDDAFCAEHTYWSTKNAEFQRFWREFNDTGKVPGWAQDTPRKPKPGDRVSTTLNDENGSTVVGKYVYVEQDAVHGQALIEGEGFLLRVRLSEITVIKPAWPADPKCDIEEDTEPGDTLLWKYNPASGSYDDGTCDRSVRWEDLWSEAVAEGSKLYPIRRERGPVIGG